LQLQLPREALANITYEVASATLYAPLLASMRASPVPPTLWRTAAKDCKVGDLAVTKGKRVIVGLGSAIAMCPSHSDGDDLVFGGKYGNATHSCPGREMAVGVMIGTLCALLKAGSLRPTANPLAVVLRA
jgi:cytochrome P450